MNPPEETIRALERIAGVEVRRNQPMAAYTRFGFGGPAGLFVEASDPSAFGRALEVTRAAGTGYVAIGGGTNLIVADEGFPGIVLRFTGSRLSAEGTRVRAEAGAALQDLVDFAIDRGLRGLETLAGIPGSVGAAIYGNAGAYGHSISERVELVRFFRDGARLGEFDAAACEFGYRDSIFKRRKDWLVCDAHLALEPAPADALRAAAGDIVKTRSAKFPPEIKCAGSVFKNLILADLPPRAAAQVPPEVVREGKVPAAWFLDQAGVRGLSRGDIHVATYHANLLYNGGSGTARQFRELAAELKERVRARFAIELEEEVQYVGFSNSPGGTP